MVTKTKFWGFKLCYWSHAKGGTPDTPRAVFFFVMCKVKWCSSIWLKKVKREKEREPQSIKRSEQEAKKKERTNHKYSSGWNTWLTVEQSIRLIKLCAFTTILYPVCLCIKSFFLQNSRSNDVSLIVTLTTFFSFVC